MHLALQKELERYGNMMQRSSNRVTLINYIHCGNIMLNNVNRVFYINRQ